MRLASTAISCGVWQLENVGRKYNPYEGYHDGQRGFNEAMIHGGYAAIIIASLTVSQKKEAILLKKNGFKQVGKSIKNPNSNNKILLFVKFNRKRK